MGLKRDLYIRHNNKNANHDNVGHYQDDQILSGRKHQNLHGRCFDCLLGRVKRKAQVKRVAESCEAPCDREHSSGYTLVFSRWLILLFDVAAEPQSRREIKSRPF
jgi:hypothetical protein